MSETADYDPGDWKGYNFKDATRSYTADAGRGYQEAVKTGVEVSDLVPAFIETDAKRPLIVVFDETGSMGEWPAIGFGKLPYLDKECPSYLGSDMQISFFAVGDDHQGDRYYLQVRPFASGTVLVNHLKELKIEGKGGGDAQESYELAALYACKNVRTPNAIAEKPILIFVGDEGLHSEVLADHAKDVHIDVGRRSRIPTDEIMAELVDKFAVYIIRKEYPRGDDEATIQAQWEKYLGADHVKNLDDPERVVDVIFGCLAQETGRLGYFHEEMEGRQTKDQCEVVFRSLKTEHFLDAASTGKSRMMLPTDAKKSRHLLGKSPPKSTDLTGYWDSVDPKAAPKVPSTPKKK